MTDEIMGLMEMRRLSKGRIEDHRKINKQINNKIRRAKEKWADQECREMRKLREDMIP